MLTGSTPTSTPSQGAATEHPPVTREPRNDARALRRARLTGRPRATGLCAAALIAASLATLPPLSAALAQGRQPSPSQHRHHDRQDRPSEKKAESAISRGQYLRARMADVTSPIAGPQSPKDWDHVIEVAACWQAFEDLRKEVKRKLGSALDGPAPDPNPNKETLDQRFDKVFNGAEQSWNELVARVNDRLQRDSAAAGGMDYLTFMERVLQRAEKKRAIELALIGLAPLAIEECPNCQPSLLGR